MGFFNRMSYWTRSQQMLIQIQNPNPQYRNIAIEALQYCVREKGMEFSKRVISFAELTLVNYPNMKIGQFVDFYKQAQENVADDDY